MRTRSTLASAVLALGLAAGSLSGQVISAYGIANTDGMGNGPDGDIILGFTDPTSPPASSALGGEGADLIFNLGPASAFYSTANGGNLTPGVTYTVEGFSPSDVTSLFGSSAFTDSDILWGIVGANGTAGGPTEGTPLNTIWAATPGLALQATSAQSDASSNVDSLTNPLSFYSPSASGNAAFVPESSGFYNTATDGGSASAGTFGIFNGSILGTLGSGGGTMTLFELAKPASGSSPGADLGVFALSSSGLTFTPTGPGQTSSTRLTNISTRELVGTGANILIPGFEISGSGEETLLIRADGPSLTQYGVNGALAQPSLSVLSGQTVISSNTGWGTNSNPTQIAGVAAQVGAFPFAAGSADCAVIVSLPAGSYTVEVSGVNNITGVALAEVYEVSSTGTRLVNISCRAQVGTGADAMISGFVISGSGTEDLLVRGDGPSLSQYGVNGVLAQPSLSIYSGQTVIASNTAWGTSSNPAQVADDAADVGAFPFASGSADSAVVVSLPAGAYTAITSGKNGTTGVALAEVYEVPPTP
jgi:hypothetical protein